MKPRPAIIYWRDAWYNNDRENNLDDMVELGERKCIRQSIGFVIERNDDYVVFSFGTIDYGEYHVYKGQYHIPMAMVQKIKYLKE